MFLPKINATKPKQHLIKNEESHLSSSMFSTPNAKLPKLKVKSPSNKFSNEEFDYARGNMPLPPLKSTKLEQRNQEALLFSNNLTNTQSDRLSMEIDKKLSSVQHSFKNFEKQCNSINTLQDAVRRSAFDSIKNTSTTSATTSLHSKIGGNSISVEMYQKFIGKAETEDEAESIAVDDNLTQTTSRTKSFRQQNLAEETGESFGEDLEICGSLLNSSITVSQPLNNHFCDNESPRSSAIMDHGWISENLSDKAFFTKLKIKDSQANRSMQRMQNRANKVQRHIEMDKQKAKLDVKTAKPFYKPRHQMNATELMGFLQANGGRTGSWNPSDKKAHEIVAHLKWYEEYSSLIESHKNQVRKWDEGKRPVRQMIYQMATEDRRTKLEDEKRRLEHMKNERVKEGERSRERACRWKDLKEKSKPMTAVQIEVDAHGLRKEMLNLADRIQSMTRPFAKSASTTKLLKPPPPPRHLHSANIAKSSIGTFKEGNEEHNSRLKSARRENKIGHIKLPPLNNGSERKMSADISNDDQNDSDSDIADQLDDTSKTFSSKSREMLSASRINEDTFSHKLRKQAQAMKRMEIRSHKGRTPNRSEELQMQSSPNSLHSLNTKKAVPSWRKIN